MLNILDDRYKVLIYLLIDWMNNTIMVTGKIDIFSVIFTNVVYLLPEYVYSYHINTDIEIGIGP